MREIRIRRHNLELAFAKHIVRAAAGRLTLEAGEVIAKLVCLLLKPTRRPGKAARKPRKQAA